MLPRHRIAQAVPVHDGVGECPGLGGLQEQSAFQHQGAQAASHQGLGGGKPRWTASSNYGVKWPITGFCKASVIICAIQSQHLKARLGEPFEQRLSLEDGGVTNTARRAAR